ncbi:probable methyltransferase PMT10 isoform X2 [Gastrolobium bilobum]|uniref:probable methyltransferase PMT10 isoform X2 n=1 Tax=Gastrolobium bilobum TaxID=150636 RepID=UPI002AAF8A17|nr:probable methyltransferase PMT10 isoform X2 [Gastrolobium bilobum]
MMKLSLSTPWSIDVLKTSSFVKITALTLFSLTLLLFFFTRYSPTTISPLIFFSSSSSNASSAVDQPHSPSPPPPTPTLPPPPSPPPGVKVFRLPPLPPVEYLGVVDGNGVMTEDFKIGDLDPGFVEGLLNSSVSLVADEGGVVRAAKVERYKMCDVKMVDYIPCLDNAEAIEKLNSSLRGEKYERHCPEEGKGLNCLVAAPKGYKRPILWPKSRDEVWFSNVPHTRLVEDKGGQNWISIKKDKFVFPGGGTQFIHGADKYLDQISAMVPDIAFGYNTRVALDIGCGVASFGAFLMQRNVTTLSIAPKDVHENQIQFALERGVPAMVAVFATHRLLFPSQAFDLIHCSRCRINWTRDDGILLLEANRLLRAGGYFVWAAQPVYKHEESLQEQWKEMEDLTVSICWELVRKEGYIAVWQKPMNNSCYLSRDIAVHPPLCESNDDPDDVWYASLKACITPLPSGGYGANVTKWPSRLHQPPSRLQSIKLDAIISREDLFKAESKYWNEIIDSYVRVYRWKEYNMRNVMDMRAGFGGFAAALHDFGIDCWVINVVPISGFNTLPVLYDRGLIGVMHDWCEPFDTYPRTYDMLHAAGLFSVEKKRCNISTIMLEMDRMLRPGGRVYIRDAIHVISELEEVATAMGWVNSVHDVGEGPYASWKILRCEKRF